MPGARVVYRPAPSDPKHGIARSVGSLHARHLLLHRSGRRPGGCLRRAALPPAAARRGARVGGSAGRELRARALSFPSDRVVAARGRAAPASLAYALQLLPASRPRSTGRRSRGARTRWRRPSPGSRLRRRSAPVRGHPGGAPRPLVAGAHRRAAAAGWPSARSRPVISRARRGSPTAPRAKRSRCTSMRRRSLLAAIVALLHPLGYVAARACSAGCCWRPRARAEKYAGLRILRRCSGSQPAQARPVRDRRDGAGDARARGRGRGAPMLETLMERGLYVPDCVAAFPSVTPVCAASIVTGVAQDRHLHSRDELVSPRGGPLHRVRLELPRGATLRDRPPAHRHRLQHEPRPPVRADAPTVFEASTTPTCAPPARPT